MPLKSWIQQILSPLAMPTMRLVNRLYYDTAQGTVSPAKRKPDRDRDRVPVVGTVIQRLHRLRLRVWVRPGNEDFQRLCVPNPPRADKTQPNLPPA
ncbi:MAG: hypothetical protein SW833_16595 [Cyanobacteriota bacterium]|nr:hypothetical protein [Cyanobacteriota bacterium]